MNPHLALACSCRFKNQRRLFRLSIKLNFLLQQRDINHHLSESVTLSDLKSAKMSYRYYDTTPHYRPSGNMFPYDDANYWDSRSSPNPNKPFHRAKPRDSVERLDVEEYVDDGNNDDCTSSENGYDHYHDESHEKYVPEQANAGHDDENAPGVAEGQHYYTDDEAASVEGSQYAYIQDTDPVYHDHDDASSEPEKETDDVCMLATLHRLETRD